MKKDVKVIETKYNGILFRSRTEARWAVFFDAIGIKYLYENEGYDLGIGLGYYLPDFYLPDFEGGSFAEVKGLKFTPNEREKCKQLYLLTEKTVILLEGIPEFKIVEFFDKDFYPENNHTVKGHFFDDDGFIRFFYEPGYQNEDGSINEHDYFGYKIVNAIIKAKPYRF